MSYRTWQRIKSEIKELELESASNNRLFQDIHKKLEKFESLNKVDLLQSEG